MVELYEVNAEHDRATADLLAFNRARLDFCEKAARMIRALEKLEKPEEAPKKKAKRWLRDREERGGRGAGVAGSAVSWNRAAQTPP